MVTLRKRKTPPPADPAPARKKSAAAPKESKATKVKEAVKSIVKPSKSTESEAKATPSTAPADATGPPTEGSTVDAKTFGGEIETHEGVKTTLGKLLDESKAGVVIFTYPKQNTPGCTKQACLFRDEFEPLTATGLTIYGLSTDAPKGNTSFKTKFSFPYTLLCDPTQKLIKPLGFSQGAGKGAKRGVFVISKSGKVLHNGFGSPDATVNTVRKIVAGMEHEGASKEDKDAAENAAEVADTAAKLDEKP